MLLFATIARLPSAVWDDMLEGWAWGKEFQLGYYKHPPLYSWIVALWFRLFPRNDVCFYLLSALNIGLGLFGVWRFSGLELGKYARLSAVSLLLFAPSYHYLGTNFNANAILLTLWPWAAYFFVKSVQTNSWQAGVSFGILAGCGLLSKYYTIVFLASCFVAALLHPRREYYFRSAAPYCAFVACCLVFTPHVVWAFDSGFPAIEYVFEKSNRSPWLNTLSALRAAAAALAIHALVIAVLLAALGHRRHWALLCAFRFLKAPRSGLRALRCCFSDSSSCASCSAT